MGNSLKRLDHPNIVTIFVGIFLGIFFGSLPIAFPGIPTPVKIGFGWWSVDCIYFDRSFRI